jgi:excisionase family DNA binding protein
VRNDVEKLLLDQNDVCAVTSLRHTKIKELTRTGQLPSVRVGDRRLYPADAVRAFVERLIADQAPAV